MANGRKRKGLSKKTRFEVFKRDSFKCQYCGRSAPDVVLEADHITPVAGGGEDDLMNLITSCKDCNAGKSDRALDDSSVVAKQRAQLEELNERREQIEMMLDWRNELESLDSYSAFGAMEHWAKKIRPYRLNESGVRDLEAIIKKVGLAHTLAAMDSAERHFEWDKDGVLTIKSANIAFDKMLGMAKILKGNEKDPGLQDRLYIRGILRNRVGYVNQYRCLPLIKEAQKAGIESDEIKELAKEVRSWSQFRDTLGEWINLQDLQTNEAQDF